MSEKKRQALLIEDDKAVALVTRSMLEFLGYEVSCAEALQAGLQHLDDLDSLDVFVTDLSVAQGQIEEILKECRQRQPSARRLVTSGRRPTAIEATGAELKDVAFLLKPFDIRKLRGAIQRNP